MPKLSSVVNDYKELLEKNPTLVNDLDLKLFFQQAERWESGHAILRKRIDQKTFDASLAYVQSLLDKIKEILNNQDASQHDKKVAIITYLTNKEVIKQGAAHVEALDKNTPTTKRFKKYLGLGLLVTIGSLLLIAGVAALIGVFVAPIVTVATVGAALFTYVIPAEAILAACHALGYACFKGSQYERKVHHPLFIGLMLLPFIIFAPLLVGITLLRSARDFSKNRQGLSLGLADAFLALKRASHCETDDPLTPDRSLAARETYDAKIAKARAKMEAFEAKSQREDSANYTRYVQCGFSYYSERVRILEGMKTFEIERGLAISPKELAEKRCDLDDAEKTLYSALQKPNKNNLLAAKYALKFGGVNAESENKTVLPEIQAKINALPSVQNHLHSNKWDVHAGKEPGYHRGVSLAHSLFMFERGTGYHKQHADKVAEARAAKRF